MVKKLKSRTWDKAVPGTASSKAYHHESLWTLTDHLGSILRAKVSMRRMPHDFLGHVYILLASGWTPISSLPEELCSSFGVSWSVVSNDMEKYHSMDEAILINEACVIMGI